MNKEQYINHFENLLDEQIKRAEKLSENKKEIQNKDKTVIGLVDGDGIGPIILESAKSVINFLLKDEIDSNKIEIKEINGLTIENRMKTGKTLPDDILEKIKSCDVLLKGPTTTPKGGTMESANVALRRELDLYANIRPVKIPEKDIDWAFFRENTEGEYVLGSKGIEIPGLLSMDFKVITVEGTKRIAKSAFEYAKNNGKNHVTIVTKANIMKKTDGLFSDICHKVAKDYPDIEVDEYYVDIISAHLIDPQMQSKFQVFVLPNLYGDIITDEAAQLQGGVSTAGSINAGDEYAMFEAIHGSAPRLFEEGIQDYASPASILRALALLLSHIGFYDKSKILNSALDKQLSKNENIKCTQFTENLINILKEGI
ncbi:MAG: isocitrate/isopropylmalate family dehydrogenase [Clostridia bacterium]|nr:isocitrate/isopropylmalate family dehydrogenase [Clostridia bacterium]